MEELGDAAVVLAGVRMEYMALGGCLMVDWW